MDGHVLKCGFSFAIVQKILINICVTSRRMIRGFQSPLLRRGCVCVAASFPSSPRRAHVCCGSNKRSKTQRGGLWSHRCVSRLQSGLMESRANRWAPDRAGMKGALSQKNTRWRHANKKKKKKKWCFRGGNREEKAAGNLEVKGET